ncbi:MAG: alpha/beta hydrolase [Robiginitomaculum sp.]|nr:MAG: alpha/beta hydrolase [Robiginitomaculum sp.]
MRHFMVLGLAMLGTACSQNVETPVPVPDATHEAVKIDDPYFTSADRVLEMDGLHVRYRDEGKADAPVLVLIHGFSHSLEGWDGLSAGLTDTYRVVRMDLPGHGLTGPDARARYSNADTVVFVEQFLDALDIKNATLVGSSLGGLVAWRLAQTHPERVDKLVLIAPGGYSINGVTEVPAPVPDMAKYYFTQAPMVAVSAANKALYSDPSKLSEARIIQIQHMMTREGNGEAMLLRAASFTLPEPTADLADVQAPTLLLWGDKDAMVPVAHGEKFVSAMPTAQLIVYENIGHVPHEEIPVQMATDILRFLSET